MQAGRSLYSHLANSDAEELVSTHSYVSHLRLPLSLAWIVHSGVHAAVVSLILTPLTIDKQLHQWQSATHCFLEEDTGADASPPVSFPIRGHDAVRCHGWLQFQQ